MLKIQEFISCFDTMQEAATYLHQNVGINTVPHRILNGSTTVYTFSLMPSTDMKNPLVRETNCLIIDNNNNLVAKAWNYPLVAESADEIPSEFHFGSSNYVMEIPDGETIVIYNIDGSWKIATDNDPNGKLYITDCPGHTCEIEIKRMLAERSHQVWYAPFKNVSPMMCFVFKYVDPYRDTILPYLSKDLYLMAVINLEDGREFSSAEVENLANRMDFAMPSRGQINGCTSLAGRLARMRTLSPGLVVRDKFGHRMTILNPIYKAVRNAKIAGERVQPTHMSKILQACRDKGDAIAVGAAYKNFDEMLRLLWSTRVELWKELSLLWNAANGQSMKDFAEIVQHHPLNFLLFMYKNGEINSLKDALANMKPGKLVSCAQNKWEKEFELASTALKYIESGGNSNGVEKESGPEEEAVQRSGSGEDTDGCVPFTYEGD